MNSLSDNQVSLYEEPVQEKIRKFIKIEFLLNKIYYFKGKDDRSENYIALLALCELYEILSRSDIKSELIREIETQNTYLKTIKQIPEADGNKLNSVLEKQDQLLQKCMKTLKDFQKDCVTLFYLRKKSYLEISHDLKMNLNAVKSHIQNGKRNLKICIEAGK